MSPPAIAMVVGGEMVGMSVVGWKRRLDPCRDELCCAELMMG
jgi:hypothetical protein